MNDITRPGKQAPRRAGVMSAGARRAKQPAQRRAIHVAARSDAKKFDVWSNPNQGLELFRAGVVDRVNIVKNGVPAFYVNVLTVCMGIPKDKFYRTIGLIRATVDRKVRTSKLLNQDESERVMGIARLVGQAQSLVEESGGPTKFNAARWVAAWLDQPLPAMNGKRPGEYMDTAALSWLTFLRNSSPVRTPGLGACGLAHRGRVRAPLHIPRDRDVLLSCARTPGFQPHRRRFASPAGDVFTVHRGRIRRAARAIILTPQ